jgi:hypothetical protein
LIPASWSRCDTLHQAVLAYLRQNLLPLQTTSPVIVETCFFLDALGKAALLNWIVHGEMAVADIPVISYQYLANYIKKEDLLADWDLAVNGKKPFPIKPKTSVFVIGDEFSNAYSSNTYQNKFWLKN